MSNLDQIVKGAPPPGTQITAPSTSPIISADTPNPSSLPDPLASLPSSPPQIYLNLLILEASLRSQWLQLRTRRRQHTFFLTLLAAWTVAFGYLLFFAPREDGSGVGGSVYWAVEMMQNMAFGSGIVTGILFYATGSWERGIRWPRRWYGHTNKGLRGFNCKLVVIKQPKWKEMLSMLSFVFSYSLFSSSYGSSYRFVNQELLVESEKAVRTGGHHALPNIHEDEYTEGYEEDLASGGDYIKLLLLPKPFSPHFRENWEVYRTEYWEKENERRAVLRGRMKGRDKKLAKEQGDWFWWTGYRGWKRGGTPDIEKTHHVQRSGILDSHGRRVRSASVRAGSHSRNSSRSVTPTAEVEDGVTGGHARRGSTASNASDRRRKKTGSMRVQKLTPAGSRSVTPDVPSPLVRENSFTSVSSLDIERSGTPGDGDSVRSTKKSSVKGGTPPRKAGSTRAGKQVVEDEESK
ncbi:Sporulation-specific SPO7 [Hyphodiscus hymeniophilus]|uniref:Sporulation-specific SPO7 n=1 Tax=Hyphodiscus hymeniophilus TaxID=353542 RepID=A0A9P7AX96_9HELO|nr:Sporulation-specific SPO7 [Hyphodiscus hymeniophilus]